MIKKVLLVLLAVVAMAGATVEANSTTKNLPVGYWSFTDEHEPMCRRISGEEQDTLTIYYRTDFDSLVLCPKGIGLLKYRFTKRIVSSTKDGYEKVLDSVEEYDIRIKWKYRKNKIHIRARYSDVSYTHVERTSDNRDGEFPSHFDNNVDEDGVEWMINTLPSYVYYPENTENERLFSCDYLDYYHHCKGEPSIPTSIEQ